MTFPELPCTWAEFVQWVTDSLDVDKDRVGYEDRLLSDIRYALLEIQQAVPRYQLNHESVYLASDFATNGHASVGRLPFGAKPKVLRYVRTKAAESEGQEDSCHTHHGTKTNWDARFDLIGGNACLNDNTPYWCWDDQSLTFYVFPTVLDPDEAEFTCKVFLEWDGVRLDYQDDARVPFDETVKETVVAYVKSNIMLNVEKNPAMWDVWMRNYRRRKQKLYIR